MPVAGVGRKTGVNLRRTRTPFNQLIPCNSNPLATCSLRTLGSTPHLEYFQPRGSNLVDRSPIADLADSFSKPSSLALFWPPSDRFGTLLGINFSPFLRLVSLKQSPCESSHPTITRGPGRPLDSSRLQPPHRRHFPGSLPAVSPRGRESHHLPPSLGPRRCHHGSGVDERGSSPSEPS